MSKSRALAAAFRNEWIKSSHHVAFWVGLIAYGVVCAIVSTFALDRAREPGMAELFVFPLWWNRVLGQVAGIGLLVAAALVVLLTASEFTARTARQNVIDGMSRRQWFAGKVLLLGLVALSVASTALVVVAAFGLATNGLPSGPAGFAGPDQLGHLTGFLTSVFGYSAVALLFATAARSPGPAIVIFAAYAMLAERLIPTLLELHTLSWRRVELYLPVHAFDRASQAGQWHVEFRRSGVPYLSGEELLLLCLTYIAASLLAAYLLVRYRDL